MNLRLRNGTLFATTLVVACATCVGQAAAATIVAPVTAFATSNFGPTRNDYSIENTIDQSGLSLDYVSGITDFDTYLASKPRHTSNANGNEWFSQDFSKPGKALSSGNVGLKSKSGRVSGNSQKANTSLKKQQVSGSGNTNSKRPAAKVSTKSKAPKSTAVSSASSTSAITSSPLLSITYGFSALTSIDGFVLWNDEYAGIGTTELWSSVDGEEYTLLSTIKPEPSKFAPPNTIVPYLAQVFSFDPTIMLFFKLMIYDCPKPSANRDSFRGCGIGEVAFSAVPSGPSQSPVVPVPAALPLLASAIGLFAWLGRRQQCRI
jgi:hypothetical protein